MLKNLFIIILFLLIPVLLPAQKTNIPAFPGAEGAGMYTDGGRGGKVLYVTKLNDDGSEGTFRWAVDQDYPRIVMFKVAGIITLESKLEIKNGDLTIAGQSAPGDGICFKDYAVVNKADNVIVRFMRFRMGDIKGNEDDSFGGTRAKNIIIDHCSMSWSTDECASFYGNENFTMQWCILSESLRNSVHVKGKHGYGGIWGGQKASFHHNLLAHHDNRNPRFCGSRYSNRPDLELVDFRNNVIFNWGYNSGYAGEGGSYNMVANYYKSGPATNPNVRFRIFEPYADDGLNRQPAGVVGKFYVDRNYMNGSPSVTNDNWLGMDLNKSITGGQSEVKSNQAFAILPVTIQAAEVAFENVLTYTGSSFSRDIVDIRIAEEVRSGKPTYMKGSKGSINGLIDSQNDVGGWPDYVYNLSDVPLDTDGDGMPDAWELENKLNPNDVSDGSKYTLDANYTNVEVYLNGLVKHITDAQNNRTIVSQ